MVPAEVEEVEVGGDGSCVGRSDRDGVRREHHVVLQDQDVGKFPALGVAESGEVREEATDVATAPGFQYLELKLRASPSLGSEQGSLSERAAPSTPGIRVRVEEGGRSRVRRWERNWALREGQCNDGRG